MPIHLCGSIRRFYLVRNYCLQCKRKLVLVVDSKPVTQAFVCKCFLDKLSIFTWRNPRSLGNVRDFSKKFFIILQAQIGHRVKVLKLQILEKSKAFSSTVSCLTSRLFLWEKTLLCSVKLNKELCGEISFNKP